MPLLLAIPGAVSRHTDKSWGMERTEITCTACGGHLGHVFKGEGFPTPSTYSSHRPLADRADPALPQPMNGTASTRSRSTSLTTSRSEHTTSRDIPGKSLDCIIIIGNHVAIITVFVNLWYQANAIRVKLPSGGGREPLHTLLPTGASMHILA